MEEVRIRDQLLIIFGWFVGGVLGGLVGGTILLALAPWWGPAKWLGVAWVQAAFLLLALGGMVAGVETAGQLAGIALPGTRSRRVTFHGATIVVIVGWLATSHLALRQWKPWGFWISMAGFAALGVALRVVAGRLHVWRAEPRTEAGPPTKACRSAR
jgi:hypothetical protein